MTPKTQTVWFGGQWILVQGCHGLNLPYSTPLHHFSNNYSHTVFLCALIPLQMPIFLDGFPINSINHLKSLKPQHFINISVLNWNGSVMFKQSLIFKLLSTLSESLGVGIKFNLYIFLETNACNCDGSQNAKYDTFQSSTDPGKSWEPLWWPRSWADRCRWLTAVLARSCCTHHIIILMSHEA